MEKKLKVNAFLKGVSIFAFVAFCLLAILAGVTLPFVSNLNTVDNVAFCSESDVTNLGFASSDSDSFNPLDFSIPLSQCNTSDIYFGFYITDSLYNYVHNYDYSQTSNKLNLSSLVFTGESFPLYLVAGKQSDIAFFGLTDNFYNINYFDDRFIYSYFTPYIVYTQGFKLSNILSNVPSNSLWSSEIFVFTSIPYGIHTMPVPVIDFNSRFGNFVGLASSDFYINLDVAPVIPSQLCQVLVSGSDTVTDNWYLKGQSTNLDIYYLPLFDKYYLNGSLWVGNVNCGWILDYFYGTRVPQLRFRVLSTDIWKADCDFNKTSGLISNVRNGQFLVSSNFISDANVYKISSADDSLYIMRDVYNDVAYSSFLDSFIAQQDFKNVKIPSDNALYLKGYQSASDEYFNNGYNTGFSDGEKSGYNTGFSAGDSAGYSRGLQDSNNYSFLSLFGAVFDAPIQALFGGTQRLPAGTKITDSNGNTITLQSATTVNRGGLLNFDLMGVNLSGFVLALFSLSILIVVIKFALGKS